MVPRLADPDVVRVVEGVRGRVPMRMELRIRFDYGRLTPWVRRVGKALLAVSGPEALVLRTPVDHHGEDRATVADFPMRSTRWRRWRTPTPTGGSGPVAAPMRGSGGMRWCGRC